MIETLRRLGPVKLAALAIVGAGLIGFFLAPGWRKLDPIMQAARLLLWWDKLVVQSGLIEGGAIFQLPINPVRGCASCRRCAE